MLASAPVEYSSRAPLRGSAPDAGQKTRAPRAPPSCRDTSVLQPAPRRRGPRNCSTAFHPRRCRISGCAGPSGPLPPKAARNTRRPKAGSMLARAPVEHSSRAPLRGSASDAGQKTRAPRAPPSCRDTSVLQPAPRRRGPRNCSTAFHPRRCRISGCAGLLARCRRRRPETRAGRRPAPCWRERPWNTARARRCAAARLMRVRRPAHPEHRRRVETPLYCNRHRAGAGLGTAAPHSIRAAAVSLGARVFWPAPGAKRRPPVVLPR